MFDSSRPLSDDDRLLISDWPDSILVAHKSDLSSVWEIAELSGDAMWVSSLTGAGVEELARSIVARLIPEVPEAGTPIPVAARQVQLLIQAREAVGENDPERFREALQQCLGR